MPMKKIILENIVIYLQKDSFIKLLMSDKIGRSERWSLNDGCFFEKFYCI